MNYTKTKEPWFAVLLSSVVPGAGQIYTRSVLLGIVFFLVCIGSLIGSFIVFCFVKKSIVPVFLLFIIGIMAYLASIFHAYYYTKKQNQNEFEKIRITVKDIWLAVFLSRLVPGLGLIYIKKIYMGLIFIILTITIQIVTINQNTINIGIYIILIVFSFFLTYAYSPVNREKNYIKIITATLLIVCSIIVFNLPSKYFASFYIPSSSMKNTFYPGDHLLIKKMNNHNPKRGEIIVYTIKDEPGLFLKRCIAVGGDKIEIKNNAVYINNKLIVEDYVMDGTDYSSGITVERLKTLDKSDQRVIIRSHIFVNGGIVPQDTIVVLGDNRYSSRDSRSHGYVSLKEINGTVIGIYWNTKDVINKNFKRFGCIRKNN